METARASAIKRFAEAWVAAGLDAGPVTEAMARYDDIASQFVSLRDAGDGFQDICAKIAAGELTLAKGVARHASESAGLAPAGPGTSIRRVDALFGRAQALCVREAVAWLMVNVDALTEAVEAAIAAADAEYAEFGVVLEGIGTAEDARLKGKKWADAWTRQHGELGKRRSRLYEARNALNLLGIA